MIRKLLFIPVLILLHTVWACGPRDIGTGTSSDTYSQPQGVSVEDRLRYPVYGASNTQRMLYWHNRPEVMERVQTWQRMQFARQAGQAVDPSDPQYRAVPKERSPFRQ